jgi:hypothetical protein
MIPDHLTASSREIKSDTRKFLNEVFIYVLRLLRNQGLSTKDCNFLGNNDILIFRQQSTDGVIAVLLSRATQEYRLRIEEFETHTSEDEDSEEKLEKPTYFSPQIYFHPNVLEVIESYTMVQPVSIMFPKNYLSLQGEELDEASKSVAELLIEPTKEDIDRKNRIVRVSPIFQGRDFLLDPNLVFTLMEFGDPYTKIYNTLIKPTVEAEGFRCIKSDDIFRTSAVIEDIWENINKAALIIAEISTNNPNVMYELGICHTVGKNVMMITQDSSSVPFNFRHLRFYPYSNDIPGSEELKKSIKSVLQQIRAVDRVPSQNTEIFGRNLPQSSTEEEI